jgi:hypothetical protein
MGGGNEKEEKINIKEITLKKKRILEAGGF